MMLDPDWVAQWSWLLALWSWRDWVGLSFLLTASLAFASARSHVVRARGGSTRRQALVWIAAFAAAAFTSGTLNAVLLQRKQDKNADALKGMHLSIFTGHSGQSYFKFGEDIANLADKKYQVTITNVPTAGSEENLRLLQGDANFESIALVQDDVLELRSKSTDSQIRVLHRLPRRGQVHIVTLSRYEKINSIGDLKGKRVDIGERGSGTNFTANLVLDMTSVKDVKRVEIAPELGLQRLSLNENDPDKVDAVFYVVSQPANIFNHGDFTTRKFKFVAIPSSILLEKIYQEDSLRSDSYDWLPGHQSVDTISIGNTLVYHQKTKPRYVEFIKKMIQDDGARLFGISSLSATSSPTAPPAR